jgi:hypothetical protein
MGELGEVRGQMYELEEEVWSMRNNDELIMEMRQWVNPRKT